MTNHRNEDARRLADWLGYFGGPVERPQSPQERKRLMAEMCAAGAERMFPLIAEVLTGADPEARCAACELVLQIGARRGIELDVPQRENFEPPRRNALGGSDAVLDFRSGWNMNPRIERGVRMRARRRCAGGSPVLHARTHCSQRTMPEFGWRHAAQPVPVPGDPNLGGARFARRPESFCGIRLEHIGDARFRD